VCVCVSHFNFLNCWTDFHDIWYECYAIGGHPKKMYNFIRVIAAELTHELVRGSGN